MRRTRQAVPTLLATLLFVSIPPGAAHATVVVSIPGDLCADPGATDIDVPIELTNDTPPTAVRGIQFTLRDDPDDLTFGSASCTSRTPGWTCTANEVSASNAITTLILDFGGGSIAPGTGAVAIIRLADAVPPCTPGSVITLGIENLQVSDINNQPIVDRIAVPGSFTCGCPITTTTTSTTVTTITTTSTTLLSTTTTTTILATTTTSTTLATTTTSSSTTSTSLEPTTTSTTTPPTTTTSTTLATTTTSSSTTSTSLEPPTTTTTTLPATTTSTTVVTTTSSTIETTSTSSTTSSTTATTVTTTSTLLTSTTMEPTTTTTASSTTTSTTLGGLVPGGPLSKTSSDCYLELRVAGVQNGTAAVESNRKIFCIDGDPCDSGPCDDLACDMHVAGCVNQTDANLDCTPPAGGLKRAKIRGALDVQVQELIAGPACTPDIPVRIEAKLNSVGKYLEKKSRLKLKGKARANPGTSPRSDTDKWILQCVPRLTPCPAATSR